MPGQTDALTIGSLIAANVVAGASFGVMPTLIEGVTQSLSFSPPEAGLYSSILMAGSATGSICSKYWVRRVDWRVAARAALLGLVIANSLSIIGHHRNTFMGLQFVGGIFGGSLYALTLTALSDGAKANRDFGLLFAGQVLLQALGLFGGPTLQQLGGIDALLGTLVLLDALSLLLTNWMPSNGGTSTDPVSFRSTFRPATLTVVIGCFLFWLSTACYWTYIGLIGDSAGFQSQQIGTALTIGVGAGFAGALIASFGGDRLGRGALLLAGTLMVVLSVVILAGRITYLEYTLSGCMLNFAWNLSLTAQLATVNAIDASRHAIAVTPAFQAAGAVVGPALAATLVAGQDYSKVIWIVIGAALLSQACFSSARRLSKSSAKHLN